MVIKNFCNTSERVALLWAGVLFSFVVGVIVILLLNFKNAIHLNLGTNNKIIDTKKSNIDAINFNYIFDFYTLLPKMEIIINNDRI